MQFLKKHYEKVLLSVVLLGLAVAAAALPLQVSKIRQSLDETMTSVVRTKPKPFKPIDVTTNEIAIKRFERPMEVKLSGVHNLFNPVLWKKNQQGGLIKISTGTEIGPGALEILKIDELKMTVSFEVAPGGPENAEPRYAIIIDRDTDPSPLKRMISKKNPKGELFTLQAIEGPPEDPTALVLLLKDSSKKDENEPIKVLKSQPYVRLIGYAADLKYPHGTKKTFTRKRKDDTISGFEADNETYKIVSITQNEVVLSAKSTEKRTHLTLNASPPLKK